MPELKTVPELKTRPEPKDRPRRGLRPRDDRGAVATVFAILLAGGVLLGSLALVLDVGQIYVEREQLQSGADAAALAVAHACATGEAEDCVSGTSLIALAQRYADSNASDLRAHVSSVCGRFAAGVEECPEPAGNVTDCLGEPPAGPSPFVEVHLSTEVADGSLVLPPIFAQTLAGNSGYSGTSVAACARARWTSRAEVSIVALAVSVCDFEEATATGFADPGTLTPADERVIAMVPPHPDCAGGESSPGPVAWLAADSSCEIILPAGGEVAGTATGTAAGAVTGTVAGTVAQPAPPGCIQRLAQAQLDRQSVYLAVYDQVAVGTAERTYRVRALAPFQVTGWMLGADPPDVGPSYLSPTPALPCGARATRCVSGVFTAPAVPRSDVAAGDAVVSLIG